MDPNESQHHHHHPLSSFFAPTTVPTTAALSPTNGLLPPNNNAAAATTTTNNNNNLTDTGVLAGAAGGAPILYPHSVGPSSAAVTGAPVEQPPKRKRGRPRKYGTPEQALPAKKASNSASPSYSASSKKSQQRLALGNAGQGFAPHVISVSAGEDVGQKLMLFMQQSKRDMCILSASGSISIASLCQPGMSGGNVTYEGRFEIISLSGSYIRTHLGGRTGGLSVCLSNTDGQIIGGGVGGPLKAAGPVQVIVGTFLLDNKKDANASFKSDNSAGILPSPVGNPYGVQHHGMQVTPPQHDWRIGADAKTSFAYDLTGRTALGPHQSPESGDYE